MRARFLLYVPLHDFRSLHLCVTGDGAVLAQRSSARAKPAAARSSVLESLQQKLAQKREAAASSDGCLLAPLPDGTWVRLPEMPLLPLCDPVDVLE